MSTPLRDYLESYRPAEKNDDRSQISAEGDLTSPITRGRNALANNELSEAISSVLSITLAIHPHHPLASIGLGRDRPENGPLGRRLFEHFKGRYTSPLPTIRGDLSILATPLAKLRRQSEARAAYERAISLNINSFDAYLGLGDLLDTTWEIPNWPFSISTTPC